MREDLRADLRHDLAPVPSRPTNVGSLLPPRLNAASVVPTARPPERPADTGTATSPVPPKSGAKARQAIAQAILARKYDVVIANPPYMGSKNQNATLKKFLGDNYAGTKAGSVFRLVHGADYGMDGRLASWA
ncbi:MAG: hypothetical protein IPH82_26780 [Chloroflexi bacterium]|nr:hypothetical protein [Chloroflexota bacterium]